MRFFALLVLVAPALGRTTTPPTAALSPHAEGKVETPTCAKCGQHNSASPNCCSIGGSWEGLCDESDKQFTWHAGFQVCKSRNLQREARERLSSPPRQRNTVKQSPVNNACAQCGYDEDGIANCCTHGGSWMGTCREVPTRSGQHSFTEGYDICHANASATAAEKLTGEKNREDKRVWWDMDKLSTLYVEGQPSNHLSLAGLTVHCFDQTEDPQELWKPCTSGYCKQFGGWWSASIINTKQHSTYGGSGIIMSPKYNKVLCSHWADMGTMEHGCNVTADHDSAGVIADRLGARDRDISAEKTWHKDGEDEREEWVKRADEERAKRIQDNKDRVARAKEDRRNARPKLRAHGEEAVATQMAPFKPLQLKDMLEYSMDPQNKAPMNEVLIDSKYYLDNLPESIAAIFYFHDASIYERTMATRAYVGMLEKYNLTEKDLKLLKVNHNAVPMKESGTIMMDESANARHFLSSHPWGRKFRRKQVPTEAPTETWRRQRLARRDVRHEDDMKRQRLARHKAMKAHPILARRKAMKAHPKAGHDE
jgi:hypothetical protein